MVVLLAAALAGVAAPAAAAVATCDGKAATIVGELDGPVWGTEGDDVIVSNGARWVYGYGGDDRICMTGSPSAARIVVFAGDGHDRVFIRTAVRRQVTAELGHGSDLYIGGPGGDTVDAGERRTSTTVGPKDAGLDRIATGPGEDHVTVGQPDLPTRDVVRLGRDVDRLTVIGTAADGHIFEGNDGYDTLNQTWALHDARPDQPLKFNNAKQVATIGGEVVLRWNSFQGFKADHHPAGVFFMGSNLAETIESNYLQGASMGGNRDVMVLGVHRIPGTLRGGTGRDALVAYGSSGGSLTGDLTTGRIDSGSVPEELAEVPFVGVENLRLLGGTVRLVGNDRANRLDAYGCNVTIIGGGGGDTLLTSRAVGYDPDQSCGSLRMSGGDGDDRLIGGARADELYGGRGHDIADGQAGSDLCRAEVRRNCERQ